MSTITTLQNTDSGSVSLGVINDNFEALNDDKIEADDIQTLENKTINADDNNITNLGTAEFATGSKTGLDTKVVTGTKGNTNEVAIWNADGDAVSSGKTITTTAPTSGSTDNTIPTSKAVQDAIADQLAIKQVYVPCLKDADTAPYASTLGNYAFAQLDSGEAGYFIFHVPADFHTLTSVELVMIPDTTEILTMTNVQVSIAAAGELYTAAVVASGSITKSVTISQMTKWDFTSITNTPFAGMSAGDVVGCQVTSGTTLMRVLGLLIKYQ